RRVPSGARESVQDSRQLHEPLDYRIRARRSAVQLPVPVVEPNGPHPCCLRPAAIDVQPVADEHRFGGLDFSQRQRMPEDARVRLLRAGAGTDDEVPKARIETEMAYFPALLVFRIPVRDDAEMVETR